LQRATQRCFETNIDSIVKKQDLEKRLRSVGCYLKREGSAYSLWINPKTGEQETVPGHNEIKEPLAKKILKNMDAD